MKIIEKEKILWKPRNAGIVCGGSAYTGIYAHGVNIRISCLMRSFYTIDLSGIRCYTA
jgi:hypothetical protein